MVDNYFHLKMDKLRAIIPGVLLTVVIGIVSRFTQGFVPILNDVMIAIIIGFLIRNTLGLKLVYKKGLDFCIKKILKLAIVLLGSSLSFRIVVQTGSNALFVILIVVVMAILVTIFVGKKFGLSERLSILIGVGTAICGVSAIVTTGPIIDAEEHDISLAVATIFVFNTIALFLYPIIGGLTNMTDVFFGSWVGIAVHDTSSVVATSFAFSDQAGAIATVVKLTRTVLLIPLVLILGAIYNKKRNLGTRSLEIARIIPTFILGFIAMSALNSMGYFSEILLYQINIITKFLILIVMSSLGLCVEITKIKEVGLRFLYTGLVASLIMAVISVMALSVLSVY